MSSQKLIIFDFDDTLTDNSVRDIHSFLHIIKQFKLIKIKQDKILEWRKSRLLSKDIIQKLIDADEKNILEKCINERLKFLQNYESYTKYVKLKSCTVKILTELNLRNHILILNSIQSNNENFQKMLKHFNIKNYFQKIITNDLSKKKNFNEQSRIKIKNKFYKQIISEFRFNEKNVIVIGNLASDMIPAANLNLRSFMIKGSFGFDNYKSQNCIQINELKQILDFI
jgi:FMN phosphatase YigB (HAD superfamily)